MTYYNSSQCLLASFQCFSVHLNQSAPSKTDLVQPSSCNSRPKRSHHSRGASAMPNTPLHNHVELEKMALLKHQSSLIYRNPLNIGNHPLRTLHAHQLISSAMKDGPPAIVKRRCCASLLPVCASRLSSFAKVRQVKVSWHDNTSRGFSTAMGM